MSTPFKILNTLVKSPFILLSSRLNRFGSIFSFGDSTPRVNNNETGHQSLYFDVSCKNSAKRSRGSQSTGQNSRQTSRKTRKVDYRTAMDQPQDTQPSAPLSPSVRQEGPAVAIRFEKAQNRIQKLREGHPGSLGVAQIMFCLFHFGCIAIMSAQYEEHPVALLIHIGTGFLMLIAGALAIASDKTLRLPIIKACLGMEVLGCTFMGFILSVYSLSIVMLNPISHSYCPFHFENETYSKELKLCEKYNTIENCIGMELLFAFAAQVATGITIASYCCKAIQCCGAPRSMPVIVIQQPSEQAES